jgi:ABC-type methionine transport system ATPase subunit
MATHNTDVIKALSKRVIALDKGHLTEVSGKKPKAHVEHSEKKSVNIEVKDKKPEEKPKEEKKKEEENEDF